MAKNLEKYQKMRDFNATPEPSGAASRRKGSHPMFVVQKHRASHLHYDFRLEMEGVLKSWAIPKGPSYDPAVKRLAMMTEDHPYDYGSFEGVIPEGNYGAGNVIIWDQGTWEFLEPGDDPVKALAAGKLTFRLNGRKLFGEWALIRTAGRSARGNEWLLLKHRDQYASEKVDVTKVAPRSVVSNLGVEEIGGENQWESSRKTTSRKPRTVADAMKSKSGPRTAAQRRATAKEKAPRPATAPKAKKRAVRAAKKR